jgi:hypothetical protein
VKRAYAIARNCFLSHALTPRTSDGAYDSRRGASIDDMFKSFGSEKFYQGVIRQWLRGLQIPQPVATAGKRNA